MLLDAGADGNSKTDGCAPLRMAAGKDNPVIVRALLNAGAEPAPAQERLHAALHRGAGGTDVVCVFLALAPTRTSRGRAAPPARRGRDGHAAVVSALLPTPLTEGAFRDDTALRRRRPRSSTFSAEWHAGCPLTAGGGVAMDRAFRSGLRTCVLRVVVAGARRPVRNSATFT